MQFRVVNSTETSPLLKEPISRLQSLINDTSYSTPESFVSLPQDSQFLEKATEIASTFDLDKLKYLFLVGIGGSSLGTQAICNAVGKRKVEIILLDTISQNNIKIIENITSDIKTVDEFVINYVSKSGNTTESVINFTLLQGALTKKFGDIKSRIVITTKAESPATEPAVKVGISLLKIPQNISGRFSVFSLVGLFPLLLAGFDVKKLLEGASSQNQDLESPATSASIMFEKISNGYPICENFFFNPEMEFVGKWLRQLIGESLGKEGRGVFPAVGIGTNDLHSMYQLYLGGPKNIYTNFIFSKNSGITPIALNDLNPLSPLSKIYDGKTTNEILENIYQAVKTTYENNKLPFAEFILEEISEKELGQLMQFKMLETYFLAQLLGVNAFDQPNVESYKSLFREGFNKSLENQNYWNRKEHSHKAKELSSNQHRDKSN